ncbi:hypothetical protein [Veronia nyctiphanis]|nr:hypothetical protein [Veronia nyctiphanis]
MKKTVLASACAAFALTGCVEPRKADEQVPAPPEAAKTIENPLTVSLVELNQALPEGKSITFYLKDDLSTDLDERELVTVSGATRVTSKDIPDNVQAAAAEDTKILGQAYETKSGQFVIHLKEAQQQSFELEVLVKDDDYFSTSRSLYIRGNSDAGQTGTSKLGQSETIQLTPVVGTENKEIAIAGQQAKFGSVEGGTTEAIEIQTDSSKANLAGGTVALEIPKDTVLKDKYGNEVTGEVTANVVYFSNDAGESDTDQETSPLDAFPGGLAPISVDLSDDTNNDIDLPENGRINFISAGFTAIELSNEKGQVVANLEAKDAAADPVKLEFKVPADTTDAEGKALELNGQIPLWSYDEVNGRWKYDGQGRIVRQEGNVFIVEAEITHLSYYNLDYFASENCRKVDIEFEVSGGGDQYPITTVLRRDGGSWSETVNFDEITSHTFWNVPSFQGTLDVLGPDNTSVIESYVLENGTEGNTKLSGNFCDDLNNAKVTLKSLAPEALKTLSVDVTSTCQDNNLGPKKQNALVQVTTSSPYKYYGKQQITDQGTVEFKVPANKEFKVDTWLTTSKGTDYKRTTVNVSDANEETTINFNAGICGTVTGTTGTTGVTGGTGG